MLAHLSDGLEGKTCLVSGSGNVATYAVEKLSEKGARVVTLSDSAGTIHDPDGIDEEKLEFVKDLKAVRRGRISEYADKYDCEFLDGRRPWTIPGDVALPCATQNELDGDDAATLVANGVGLVIEGANMPSTLDAIRRFRSAGVAFAPGKAANAGGVGVSGLEQAQNALHIPWKRHEVESKLREIMTNIHDQCVEWGTQPDGSVDYVDGANLAGFQKVGSAMLAYGVV